MATTRFMPSTGAGKGQPKAELVWHAADLRNAVDAVRVIEAVRPTHLFHGAWMATPGIYLSSPENLDWMQAGVAFVRAFAEQGGQRFVGVGSSAEYAASDVPCEEDYTPLQPSSVYGECKVALWYAVQALARHHKMKAAWGRLFLPYGPGDAPARLIPTAVSHLRANKPLSLSHGEQKRDFIYAPDAARMFMRILNSEVMRCIQCRHWRGSFGTFRDRGGRRPVQRARLSAFRRDTAA